MHTRGGHAVVLGAGVAGLLAARALAEHFERVTVVEREPPPGPGALPEGGMHCRRGQILQPRGLAAIEALFPGITSELVARGAMIGDIGEVGSFCFLGHRVAQTTVGERVLTASRPLLEGYLRTRLSAYDNVDLVQNCDARGLVLDGGTTAVTGVRLLSRRDGSAEEVLPSRLVVDATGRRSRLPVWLSDAGLPTPAATLTHPEVVSTTLRYPRLDGDDRHVVVVMPHPRGARRAGEAVATEDDVYLVTLFGLAGEAVPAGVDGVSIYSSTLSNPDLHDLVRDRAPLGEPTPVRHTRGHRHHYESLDRFPEGLLVLGDALCSFNPVHGQGASVAAIEAQELATCLQAGATHLGRRYFAAIGPTLEDTWTVAAHSFPGPDDTRAQRSLRSTAVERYQRRLASTAAHDTTVARTLLRVVSLTTGPRALTRPRIAARVLRLRGWRSKRRGARGAPGPTANR